MFHESWIKIYVFLHGSWARDVEYGHWVLKAWLKISLGIMDQNTWSMNRELGISMMEQEFWLHDILWLWTCDLSQSWIMNAKLCPMNPELWPYESWIMNDQSWIMTYEFWSMNPELWPMKEEWILNHESRIMNSESWILNDELRRQAVAGEPIQEHSAAVTGAGLPPGSPSRSTPLQ